jgi:N-acetyl sugar amidotransferase
MKYCRKCLLPNTKPYLTFDDEGVCQACRSHERKQRSIAGIDWKARSREFDELVESARGRSAPYFDVMVPVSGGKDSITQVHRLLNRGLRILAVHVDYGVKTEVGRRNLARVPEMGAMLFTLRPNLPLHRRLIRIGLEDFGDPDLLSHTLLHAGPLHVAMKFEIPLVLLGENSAAEYGGAREIAESNVMTRSWFDKYAANAGHDARFVSKEYSIPFESLRLYDYPDELDSSGTNAVFMSHYFPWDSETHLKIATTHGFVRLGHPSEGTYRDYVGIDERINRVHQYLKVLKFGYGRATDHACEDIRNGRLSREKAKALVREHDLLPISQEVLREVGEFIGYGPDELNEILERFRNLNLWRQDRNGEWMIEGHLEDDTASVETISAEGRL